MAEELCSYGYAYEQSNSENILDFPSGFNQVNL